MKAKVYQVDALKPQLQKQFRGAFIFGPDFGVVQEITQKIKGFIISDPSNDFAVTRLQPMHIKDTPSILLDEGNTPLLLGGRRLILLRDTDNTIVDAVDSFVTHVQTDAFLLMTADNLPPKSPLRIFCEECPDILTIACYTDEARDVEIFIRETLRQSGITVPPTVLSLLTERLSENRIATRQELDKLITYLGPSKTVTAADVSAIITDAMNTTIDAFCCAVAEGNSRLADKNVNLLLSSGENPVTIIRILNTHFNKLLTAADCMAQTGSADDAVKKIMRAAQFRLKETFRKQVMIWKKEYIFKVLGLLLSAEQQMKSTALPPELILSRTVTQITSRADHLRR